MAFLHRVTNLAIPGIAHFGAADLTEAQPDANWLPLAEAVPPPQGAITGAIEHQADLADYREPLTAVLEGIA